MTIGGVQYPLINKPWFINPGLTLLQFVTCYQEVPLWPRARLEVQESLVENRLRADCPRPFHITTQKGFLAVVTVMKHFMKFRNTTIINNHNNTRQSLHPHPLTSAVRQLPSAVRSVLLLGFRAQGVDSASPSNPAGWKTHLSVAQAWLRESGLVCDRLRSLAIACDRLRSLAIACCDQAQVYQVWCLMVFECFWSEMM